MKKITKKLLFEKYKTMTQPDLAEYFGCSHSTITRLFRKYRLRARTSAESTLLKMGKDVVAERLRGYAKEKKKHIPKKEFVRLYKSMSLDRLAKHFGCGQTLIWRRIREFGLKPITNSERLTGKAKTEEHRLALSIKAFRRNINGKKNPNYKGADFQESLRHRFSSAYVYWRRMALKKFGNKCTICGIEKGKECECCGHRAEIHVHHKESFRYFPEKRFSLENALVVCEKCHRDKHSPTKTG